MMLHRMGLFSSLTAAMFHDAARSMIRSNVCSAWITSLTTKELVTYTHVPAISAHELYHLSYLRFSLVFKKTLR